MPTLSAEPSSTNGAPSKSQAPRLVAPGGEDEAVCRICLGGEDDDLGRLIVPCKCSGTARFVHEECLTSWRLADRKNGFYACTMCGARYQLRKTLWTRLAASRATIPLLAFALALAAALVSGFAAPPFMRFAEGAKLSAKASYWKSNALVFGSKHYFLSDLLNTGDALREAVSSFGFLLGSCEWSSARELQDVDITSPEMKADGWSMSIAKRLDLTFCGRYWGYETDEEPVSLLVGAVMHLFEGYVLVSLLLVLAGQLMLRWFMLRNALRGLKPAWADALKIPNLERPDFMAVGGVTTFTWQLRYFVKRSRAAGRLFSPAQVVLLLTVAGCVLWSTLRFRQVAEAIVKWRVAQVENVVLDVREVDAEKKGKKEE
ncbi:hypothetical protein JCM6882_006245 [Rhodosporidiobolus microsporus]